MAPVDIAPSADALARAAAALAGAERPLIVAQRGAGSEAGFAALAALATEWAIPVCQYWAVQLAIATDHPMHVGVDPGPFLADADVVLVIDSLAPWSPALHGPPADCTVIQAGPDPLYARFQVRNFRCDLALAGDTAGLIISLRQAMQPALADREQAIQARHDRLAPRAHAIRSRALEAAAAGGVGERMTKAWVSRCLSEAIVGHPVSILSELGCPLAVVSGLANAGLGLFQSHLPGSGQPVSPLLVYGAALGFWMNVLIGRLGWVNYPLGVLWSRSVEEVFYLIFPAVCLLLRRPRWIAGFWLVVVLVGPAYRAAHQGDEGGFLFAYFAAFDGIAVGCLAALTQVAVAGWLAGAAAIGIVATYLAAPIGLSNVWGVSAMAAGTAVLLLRCEQGPQETVGTRWGRMISWFGRLSYELYLFHLVVLGILRTAFPAQRVPADGRLLLLLLFLAASACIAAAVGRLYAEPLNRALRRRLLAPPPGRAAAQPQPTAVPGRPSPSNRA